MSVTPIRQPAVDAGALDVERIRADFPILRNVHPHGKDRWTVTSLRRRAWPGGAHRQRRLSGDIATKWQRGP